MASRGRRQIDIRQALDTLRAAAEAIDRPVAFMEVCGTHTMAAFRSGLHGLLPPNVRLISGPGCPVCVTAQSDIDQIIELAMDRSATICTYGDMLRVPGSRGSLETARSRGAAVRVIYSTMDAVKLAQAQPDRQVVLAAVGFETTAPATAAALLAARQAGLDNFSVLVSHKQVLPAMTALLDSGEVGLDGFLCPGHVSVIVGARAFEPIVDQYRLPCVVGGFEAPHIAAALARLTQCVRDGRAQLINQYPQAVTDHGNATARAMIEQVFEPGAVRWRGLGTIPDSGLVLRPAFTAFDAAQRFALATPEDREPRGCRCGEVIRGLISPDQCKLFANACTPVQPIGPCMVSSEGTCAAWFKYSRATMKGQGPEKSQGGDRLEMSDRTGSDQTTEVRS